MTENTQFIHNSSKTISIRYTYPDGLEDKHSIDLDIYQETLKTVGAIINRANKITNGKNSEIQIEVLANKEGSFLVELVVFVGNTLSVDPTQFLNFLGFAGNILDIGWKGIEAAAVVYTFREPLISFANKIKGRNITKQEVLDENHVKITLDDEDILITYPEVIKYYNDPTIRKNLEKMARCFKNAKIEKMEFSSNSNDAKPESITKEEAKYLTYPKYEPQYELMQTKTDQTYQILAKLNPETESSIGAKLRFVNLELKNDLEAKIQDEEYLEEADSDLVSFKAGTVLSVGLGIDTSDTHTRRRRHSKNVSSEGKSIQHSEEGQSTLINWEQTDSTPDKEKE